MPQLGFQYLSAVLQQKNVESDVWDQAVDPFSMDDLKIKIDQEKYDIIGFYSATALKSKIVDWVKMLKAFKKDLPVIVGGPGSFGKEEYLMAGCDMVCHGEGERVICDVVDYYKGEKALDDIKGISTMKDGVIVEHAPQDLVEDLDSLPFPRRDKKSVNQYFNYHVINMKRPFVPMIASRGCPRNCSFCSSPNMWNRRVRFRSPENVVAEIDEVVEKYGVKYISFKDDIFGLNLVWLRKFCNLLIERNYDLHWMCLIHPLSFRNHREEILELMHKAGCDTLLMGIQSVDPTVLKNINRFAKETEEARELIQVAKKKHFLMVVHFIVGLPGETEDTVKKNIDFVMSTRPHFVEFYQLIKLEGTEIASVYKDSNPCQMTAEEIKGWAGYAMKRFYSDPRNFLQIVGYVLRHNPIWFFKALRFLNYFLGSIGLKKS